MSSPEEALLDAVALASVKGGAPTMVICPPDDAVAMVSALEGRIVTIQEIVDRPDVTVLLGPDSHLNDKGEIVGDFAVQFGGRYAGKVLDWESRP